MLSFLVMENYVIWCSLKSHFYKRKFVLFMLQGWERRKEEGKGAIVFFKQNLKTF
jgi:hypothetical protein